MGFPQIATHLVVFITIVGLLTGLVLYMGSASRETRDAMITRRSAIVEKLKTDVVITNVYYRNDTPNTADNDFVVYVKNVGETQLKITERCPDLYVNNEFIDVALENITWAINQTPITYWKPEDTIKLNITDRVTSFPGNSTVEVKFVTCNGVSSTYQFST